jgi:hypothetical protein
MSVIAKLLAYALRGQGCLEDSNGNLPFAHCFFDELRRRYHVRETR